MQNKFHATIAAILATGICLVGLAPFLPSADAPATPPIPTCIPTTLPNAATLDPLPKHALARLGSRLFRLENSSSALAFTPDGKELVCAGFLHKLLWIDVRTGRIVRQITDTSGLLQPDRIAIAPRSHWLAYSPDDEKKMLRICDLATAKPLAEITAPPTDNLTAMSSSPRWILSPDEKWLALSDSKSTLIIDTTNWKIAATLKGERAALPGACFSADSKYLAMVCNKSLPAGNNQSVISFFEVGSFKHLRDTDEAVDITSGPYAMANALTTLENYNIICQWSWQTGKETNNIEHTKANFAEIRAHALWPFVTATVARTLREPPIGVQLFNPVTLQLHQGLAVPDQTVSAFTFSNDQKIFAIGTEQGCIGLFDPVSGKLQWKLGASKIAIVNIVFSADSQQLAARDREGLLSLWNLADHTGLTASSDSHSGWIWDLQASLDGRELVSRQPGTESNICRWDLITRTITARQTANAPSLAAIFAPDSHLTGLIDINEKQQIGIIDPAGVRKPLGELGQNKRSIFAPPAWTWNDRQVAWWESDAKRIQIANATTGKVDCTLLNISEVTGRLLFLPGKNPALVAAANGKIQGWNPLTGTPLFKLDALTETRPLDASRQGRWLAVANDSFELAVWDLTTNKLAMPFQKAQFIGYDTNIWSFAPDESWIAFAKYQVGLVVYDLIQNKEIARLANSKGTISFAASPDSRWIVTGDMHSTVCIYSAATGSCHKTLRDAQSGGIKVLFSPDGKTLFTGGWDSTILLWDFPALIADPDQPVTIQSQPPPVKP